MLSITGGGRARRVATWWPWLLALLAVITSGAVAVGTRFNVHPDEIIHADAFCYFEHHWWPPDLRSDEVLHCVDGWSRAFNAEAVYLVFGRVSAVVRTTGAAVAARVAGADAARPETWPAALRLTAPITSIPDACRPTAYVYRLLNVALLAVALGVLLVAGRRHAWPRAVALLLVCLPQVLYVYAYANSDAWALTVSLVLFSFAITRSDGFLASHRDMMVLGVLVGLVLLAKASFWIALPFSAALLAAKAFRHLRRSAGVPSARIALNVALLCAIALAEVVPLAVLYPWSQGDFHAVATEVREAYAWEGRKPSHPTAQGFHLAARGEPLSRVWKDGYYRRASLESFYGRFGYMTVGLPTWLYAVAATGFLLAVVVTALGVARWWPRMPALDRAGYVLAPVAVVLVVVTSIYHSWTYDMQAQGRYLFAALVPIAWLMGASAAYEPRWLRAVRRLGVLVLFALCLYAVWFVVLRDASLT